jgi:hypothetical protein
MRAVENPTAVHIIGAVQASWRSPTQAWTPGVDARATGVFTNFCGAQRHQDRPRLPRVAFMRLSKSIQLTAARDKTAFDFFCDRFRSGTPRALSLGRRVVTC